VYTLAPAAMFSGIWIGPLGAVKCGPFNTSVKLELLIIQVKYMVIYNVLLHKNDVEADYSRDCYYAAI